MVVGVGWQRQRRRAAAPVLQARRVVQNQRVRWPVPVADGGVAWKCRQRAAQTAVVAGTSRVPRPVSDVMPQKAVLGGV